MKYSTQFPGGVYQRRRVPAGRPSCLKFLINIFGWGNNPRDRRRRHCINHKLTVIQRARRPSESFPTLRDIGLLPFVSGRDSARCWRCVLCRLLWTHFFFRKSSMHRVLKGCQQSTGSIFFPPFDRSGDDLNVSGVSRRPGTPNPAAWKTSASRQRLFRLTGG